jgi:hypothetical protein
VSDKPANAGPKQVTRRTKGGQFAPGASGNPRGKLRGTKHRTTVACEALLDRHAHAVIQKILELALGGDPQLLKWVGDRLVPPRRDRPIALDFGSVASAQDALNASRIVLQAVATGALTPSEGEMLSKALSVHIGLHGAVEVESQLSVLEQAHGLGGGLHS